ncbi:MAG: Asp-tRNA(Asn)/Glu-tRNA(Gln) amidotransferase subunit GatB [Candidatus Microsaccharimonas sossegonensis]|uniref:Aspartyl/glutamyl-tRNA(Asn/Gln) amidotransferase subunit B n=1 Tax=Candidatus Microsaccharimonas sossegonensis TaxID=2506948 RepID=A0A4Q0AI33_9BACT|nr:MAG: Asp-tRNA(Asn)/Glu-tRNA(Gln) amidotransferase subunit GatB [Candidatus Microsaccharimonas sossegonensis]
MVSLEILDKYDMTIGIECHVQLATMSKLFSGADNNANDKNPNAATSPIDFGLPGMLPVLNHQAIVLAVRAGKALNADIAHVSRFDRKHYFYPDLPKGYQISQMYQPIIIGGYVEAPLLDGTTVKVRIHHAHIEEDAGKLTHHSDFSLVDLNRAGTPLIEVVSEPDIHSAAAAKAYATELHRLMTFAGVTHGDLYHGNMRFDVNISVALKGATELGTRAEIKNLNSFRSVEKAAEYEFSRQVELIEKGEKIVQETRGWDDATGKTSSQRSKEDAQDYRYMPDADIPPVVLSVEDIAAMQADVPLLPAYYRNVWKKLTLDRSVTETLLSNQKYATLITEIQHTAGDDAARHAAHWFASSVSAIDETATMTVTNFVADGYIELAEMVEKNEVSSTAAKDIFVHLLTDNISPRHIAEAKNLLQVSDESAIIAIIDEVLADPVSAQSVVDIKAGQDKAIGFLVGQVMKKSAGKANPALAGQLIRRRLEELS